MSISAGGDLAFLRDACALVVCEEIEMVGFDRSIIAVMFCAEWRPIEQPLEPTIVVSEATIMAKSRGAESIMTDVHARALMIEVASKYDMGYRKGPNNGDQYKHTRKLLADNYVAYPACNTHCVCDGKGVCDRLTAQLRRARVRVLPNRLRTEHDQANSAHGDLVEAWALAAYQLRHPDIGDTVAMGIKSRFG